MSNAHAIPARGGDELRDLIAPFADYHGDLPDYDHPLRPTYESGIQYAVDLLAKELGVDDYQPCDGTEEFDGDLGGTLMNIVLEAMPKDKDGDPIPPRDLSAALASTDMAGAGETPRERIARVVAWEHFGIAWKHMEKASHTDVLAMVDRMLAAAPVEGLTSGEGDRYADGYAQGQADAEQQHQWMQDKAWQDAVLMLVHYQTLAERTWLVGHEEAARKLAEWWKRAKALAYTKSVEEIAASPKATATASVREGIAACIYGHRHLHTAYNPQHGRVLNWPELSENDHYRRVCLETADAILATLTDSGTADTHAGSGEGEELKEALKPFAEIAHGEVYERFKADAFSTFRISNNDGSRHLTFINAECFDAARAALHPVDSRNRFPSADGDS